MVRAIGHQTGRVHVAATERAAAVIDRVRQTRSGRLTITIGTGCCESTAPFLYEDYWVAPDQEQVGEVAGVPVYAPEHLRASYPGDDGMVIDVLEDQPGESLSIETELDCRFILRGSDAAAAGAPVVDATFGVDLGRDPGTDGAEGADDVCASPVATRPGRSEATVPSVATGGPSQVRGDLPEALRRMQLR